MLIATLSYCRRKIIPLQRVVSTVKSNVRKKMVFILKVLKTLTLPLPYLQIACNLFYR